MKYKLGTIVRVKNTNKRSNLEADHYWIANLTDHEKTKTGVALTDREFRIAVKRFLNNKEDHFEIDEESRTFLGKLINDILGD